MAILFFCRLFYPHIGGVENHVLEVGKRLVEKGHRVIVITEGEYQSRSSGAKLTGSFKGIKIYRIPVGGNDWFKKFRIWQWIYHHRELIKNADIVHCHDVFFWFLPFKFLYPNKPVFITFHGYETKFPPSKKAIFIRKLSEKLSFGNVCVGDYLKKWYGTVPTFITYGGIEIRNSKSEIRNKFKIQPFDFAQGKNSKLKILFVGRLEEDTGVLIYLRDLEILKEKKIDYEFEACGDGSLRSKVEQYGRVCGFVENLDFYLKKTDIVFASSYLSILEAMKHKKLVVSVFDNSLKEDYLKMSPFSKWIIIEDSPKKLVDKILYFIKHQDEKEKITNTAYKWVKEQTWEKVSGIYIDLWSRKVPDRQ